MGETHLSVIIPAYNEGKIILNTIDTLTELLKQKGYNFEIIVGDDGSTDNTSSLTKEKIQYQDNLVLVSTISNYGKGAILRKCFEVAKGDLQLFIDADLSIDPKLIYTAVSLVESGSDIAIASKHAPNASVKYPISRWICSKAFTILTRQLLNSTIKDYQCGLKCFRKKVIDTILPELTTDGFLIDTEMIVLSERKGFTVREFPAKVSQDLTRRSKLNIFKDSWTMGLGLLKLKQRIKK